MSDTSRVRTTMYMDIDDYMDLHHLMVGIRGMRMTHVLRAALRMFREADAHLQGIYVANEKEGVDAHTWEKKILGT